MYKKFLFSLFSITFLTLSALGATIPGGAVSGTWDVANSPYYIEGNITIQSDDTLTIEPGVEVEFQGDYGLTVTGLLEAVGTETDSIKFFPVSVSTGWAGIQFDDAPNSSHLIYCSLRNAGERVDEFSGTGGIVCSNSNPVIERCNIYDNTSGSDLFGGGITISNTSSPEITHCTFTGNLSPTGGGIAIFISNATITNCFFTDNCGVWGGGVYLYNSQAILTDCEINNAAVGGQWGGGIYGENSMIVLTNCIISNNFVFGDGGGICFRNVSATLTGCSLYNNTTESYGGAIACMNNGSSVVLFYCTFWNNTSIEPLCGGGAISLEMDRNNMMTIDHCTFYGNESISGFGEAIFLGGRADIQNSIFVENGLTGNIWVWAGGAVSSVAYSDFYGNVTNIGGSGSIPANFEVITTTNYNGDPCDVYYNIFEEDPLFEDAGAGNFQITWENFPTVDGTRSPCIDAGNPSFAYDSDGTITDMGRFFFDQTILMDITSPNGGEDWMVGDNHNITWSSAGTSGDVEIEYSTNNGSDWTEIIASTPDDGSYSWTVPDAPSDSCLVRVTDTDGSPSDTSDAVFIISPVPFITVTSPNGGEGWMVGTNHIITWSSAGTSGAVKIEYSTNNGSDWTEMTASTPDDGDYLWTVPDVPSSSCLVMITDTNGSLSDTSDAVFIISSVPFITLISPNGGEEWMADSTYAVTWSSAGTSGAVKIEYSTNNGSDWTDVIASTTDDGTYLWSLPDAPSDSCLVMITDTDGNPSDTSDALFTISSVSGGSIERLPEVYSFDVKGVTTNYRLEAGYALPEKAGDIRFVLYNIAGLKVKEDVLREIPAGFHSKSINMSGMSKGIYFINIEVNGGEFTKTAKFVLM